jgi:ATP-dependent DNA helicase RecQ
LEFEDVVILNGGWETASKGEDRDAPRRLFYVAMTRARRSLSIMTNGAHPFLDRAGENILHRRVAPDEHQGIPVSSHYQMPDLKLVDLSWAGRLTSGHQSLSAIGAARIGDPVQLVAEKDTWLIKDSQGCTLGRMAKSWSPPDGRRFLSGEVGAIVRWRKSDSKEEFRTSIKREEWEAVLPELLFG